MASLDDLATASRVTLEHLETADVLMSSLLSNVDIHFQLHDVRERYELWARNIGALLPPLNQLSLDHRLRNSTKL